MIQKFFVGALVVAGFTANAFALSSAAEVSSGRSIQSVAGALPDEVGQETAKAFSADELEAEEAIRQMNLQEPKLSPSEEADLQKTFAHVDPQGIVPMKLRLAALAYFYANQSRFANKNYVTVVDFSTNSSLVRFFVIDLKSGAVLALHVAHGKGSDTNNDGFAERFSNTSGSEMSSLGFYATAETYTGHHGLSLRLDGLSSTNSHVRAREIVIHGASYVSNSNVKAGRSFGCFALPMSDRNKVISMLKGGSLIFAGQSK